MKNKNTIYSAIIIVGISSLISGCSSAPPPARAVSPPLGKATSSAPSEKHATRERFTAEFISGEDKPPQSPQDVPFAYNSRFSGNTRFGSYFLAGNYILQVEPVARKPIRITLFGVPEELVWGIDDPSVAALSGERRQAVLDFKSEGRVKILVKSGETVVFRLGATAVTGKGEKEQTWQVAIGRQNEDGKTLDMYGSASD